MRIVKILINIKLAEKTHLLLGMNEDNEFIASKMTVDDEGQVISKETYINDPQGEDKFPYTSVIKSIIAFVRKINRSTWKQYE